jgi:hypothetical protein
MSRQNPRTSQKWLFHGALFPILGRFSPISVEKSIFQKGHLREIHCFFIFDSRQTNDSVRRWASVQGRHRSAGFPSEPFFDHFGGSILVTSVSRHQLASLETGLEAAGR